MKGNVDKYPWPEGRPLPTVEDIELVATRDWSGEPDERQVYLHEVYEFYVRYLVFPSAGTTLLPFAIRRTTIMIDAKYKGKPAVPPTTEAFAIASYENCRDKWGHIHQWKEVDKKEADVPKYSLKDHDNTVKWKGKFTENCVGNVECGGWNKEGRVRFNALVDAIKNIRRENAEVIKEKDTPLVEKLMQEHIDEKKRKALANGKPWKEESAKKARMSNKKASEEVVVCGLDDE